MNNEDIKAKLREAGVIIADMTNEIMAKEGCIGVVIAIQVENIMGHAAIAMDCKTTAPHGLHEVTQKLEEAMGIPQEKQDPRTLVEDTLKRVSKKQGGESYEQGRNPSEA